MSSNKSNDRCVAYITRKNMLLVFRHIKYPEAGVQVPAGHPEENESLDSAILREAEEETGLKGFKKVKYLGFRYYDIGEDRITFEKRHFFHLIYEYDTPDCWSHNEKYPSTGPDNELDFLFYWVPITEAGLSWNLDVMLDLIEYNR